MELLLIRHAQPAWADARGIARNDPGLSTHGHDQAERLARYVKTLDDRIDHLLVSPAVRARETAAPLEQALHRDATVTPWAWEIGIPRRWEGTPEEVVVAEIARNRKRPREQWWDGAPGGETFRDFHNRITSGVDGMLAGYGITEHAGDPDHLWEVPADAPNLVLVAHAGTNSVLTSHLLGLDPQPWEWERFPCDHTSITVLRTREVGGGAIWALEYFSDVGHLPREAVTA